MKLLHLPRVVRVSVVVLLVALVELVFGGRPAFAGLAPHSWAIALGASLVIAAVAWALKVPHHRGRRALFVLLVLGWMVGRGLVGGWTQPEPRVVLAALFEKHLEKLERQTYAVVPLLADASAAATPKGAPRLDQETQARLVLFERVQRAIEVQPFPGDSVFLVDGDGVAVAWAGAGLRHALPESDLPAEGPLVLNSFTATTLCFVLPVDGAEGFRVIVGASYSAMQLPEFLSPPGWAVATKVLPPVGAGRLWSIRADGEADLTVGGSVSQFADNSKVDAVITGRAVLALTLNSNVRLPTLRFTAVAFLLCLMLVGFDCLVVDGAGWRWGLGAHDARRQGAVGASTAVRFELLAICAGAVLVAWHGCLIDAPAALMLCWCIVLCAVSSACGRWVKSLLRRQILTAVLLVASALAIEWLVGRHTVIGDPLGLGAFGVRLFPSIGASILGLATMMVTFVVLRSLSLFDRSGVENKTLLTMTAVALITVAHLPMQSWIALIVLVSSGCVLQLVGDRRRLRDALRVLVFSGLLTASFWTVTLESYSSDALSQVLNPTESVFSEQGRADEQTRLRAHFAGLKPTDLSLGVRVEDSPADDLGLLVWLSSPLSRASGPSAVRLVTRDASSFFGFGLSEGEDGQVALERRAVTSRVTNWARDAMLSGSVLIDQGESGEADVTEVDRIEYFLIPAPRLGSRLGLSEADLARRFLLGESFLPSLWRSGSAIVVGPWEGDAGFVLGTSATSFPDVIADTAETGTSVTGRVQEQWFEESFSLVRTVTNEQPIVSVILRTLVQLSASLLIVGVLLIAVVLSLYGRRKRVGEFLGPFSRRLVLAFGLLASVPIVLLSVLLLRSFSDRLQAEQRAAGEAALSSAERMVGDYLSSLDPGFSVTSILDDELLSWISLIVGHEVNLYWRGNVLTSSRPELFSSGLLPSQVPGDVFAALDLEGRSVSSRTNSSAGGSSYLELYRPVELPGAGGFGLFVSVPLLAQEFETTLTLERLLNQVIVLAVLLTLLLIAVAIRFAEGLTKPITEIVAGTQRIAAGDTSLGHASRIPELQILADAIDDMALRIASGRERLLREKQVVDTVVANIKSAVVSFGENERVIMTNREAADLLGVRAGDSLEQLVERLESAELVEAVSRRPQIAERTSVQLDRSGESAEWTVQWLPIEGAGDPAALLVLEDVTEVLRAQRLAAWAEMALIIAHEVKNPLTPIRLSAEHLRRVYQSSPEKLEGVFEQCIDNILSQVDELRLIAEEFSTYSRIPTANKTEVDLGKTVREVVESYSSASSDALAFTSSICEQEVNLVHDRRLIGRVLRNLYENAIRACDGRGRVHLALAVVPGLGSGGSEVLVTLRDSGPGVAPKDLHRIFEPTFSASTGGTGLGLPISKSIVEDHGGSITAENGGDGVEPGNETELGGLLVSIRLPLGDLYIGQAAERQ